MPIFYDKILAQLRLDIAPADGAFYDPHISRQMFFRTGETEGYTYDSAMSQVRQGDPTGPMAGDGFLLEDDVCFLLLEDGSFLLLE